MKLANFGCASGAVSLVYYHRRAYCRHAARPGVMGRVPGRSASTRQRFSHAFDRESQCESVRWRDGWTLDWDDLPEEVQLICCNMMFNLGGPRFSGFKKFIAAVDQHDWPDAAREMKDSRWHRQVQNRSSRLIERMLAV